LLRWRRRAPAGAVTEHARPVAQRTPPGHQPAGADRPAARCSGCGAALELRRPPPGSVLQPVYLAVVCRLCGWIECKACKGSPSDAPCTICGSPVTPAYAAFFAEP
jgi:hypothetical protein